MINELILETMYTDAIRNMVSSINESLKSRFKCKDNLIDIKLLVTLS